MRILADDPDDDPDDEDDDLDEFGNEIEDDEDGDDEEGETWQVARHAAALLDFRAQNCLD